MQINIIALMQSIGDDGSNGPRSTYLGATDTSGGIRPSYRAITLPSDWGYNSGALVLHGRVNHGETLQVPCQETPATTRIILGIQTLQNWSFQYPTKVHLEETPRFR